MGKKGKGKKQNTKNRPQNTQKKKQMLRSEMKLRNWVEVFLLLAVVGMILVRAMYLDGYDCSELTYASGGLVASVEGYQVDGSDFSYTGDENTYFQIVGGEGIGQLFFSFLNAADQEIQGELFYLDSEGNLLDASTACVWKKGNTYMKVDIEEGTYNSFLVKIPADFSLSSVYYAVPNKISSGRKIGLGIFFLFLSAILAAMVLCFKPVRDAVVQVEQKVVPFGSRIKENWKKIAFCIPIYGVIVGVGSLIVYLMARQGRFRMSGHLLFLVFVLGIMVLLMVVRYRDFSINLPLMGAVAILLSGAAFAFTEPANVGISWDDEIHYKNAVQLSHFFDKKISISDAKVMNDYAAVATGRKNYTEAEQKYYNDLLDVLERSGYYVEMPDYAIGNTTVAYLPSALGLSVGRALGLPFHLVLAIGRWMNTWLLAILCYFAMKKLKTGKIVVLLIALLPTNLFLAGSYTYDTWLTAWSILGLAAFFGEWQRPEKKISLGSQILIAVSMYLAVCPKQVYFPLTCIALFMPMSKFSSKKDGWIYRGMVAAAALLPFFMVYIQNFSGEGMGQGDIRGGETVDAASQIEFIKTNPSRAGQIFFQYLKGYLNPYTQGAEYTTKMAYMGYIPVDFRYILGIVLAGAIVSREEKEPKFPWWSKAGGLLVYVVIGFIAALSMYIAFTPVGLETINGCQGRYLLPALFPVLYLWSRFSCKTWIKNAIRETNIHILLIAALMLINVWGVWSCCIAFY